MRAVLVDDEQLALLQLKRIFEHDIKGVDVVETCSNPHEVVEIVTRHQPDIVFLDIQMPEVNGLKLGERLQSSMPSIEIVFVTAYDRYAVRAFELYAIDYIMKPVHSQRLQLTVQRLSEKIKVKNESQPKEMNTPFLFCFNQIRYQLPGEEPQPIKWRTSKARELFAFLLHNRGRSVDRSTLTELLWPNLEESRAQQQLYTTIYHIRQTLKKIGMDTVTINSVDLETGYRLTVGEAQVDVEQWENKLKQLAAPSLELVEEYEQIFQQFDGNYLGDYEYLWAEHERERLRILWLNHTKSLGKLYIKHGMMEKAIQVYRTVQQQLPDEEETYFTLIELYDALGDKGGVEEQYWLLSSRSEKEWE